ncbi:MAG TPA: aminodeoxychorismate synthase, component I, partial [Deltaproteobacteria bacterium]|nr:aminodeoxychorismate synthase, component I [Deltaproteobacteria bacterium]
VSASPESFLRVDSNGRAESRPIKGTRARGIVGTGEDDAERQALLRSAKDRAELSMIVDLVRNDLGRVCVPGSVSQQPALEAEAHPTVWHLVGDVSGQLAPGRQALTLLQASFPPGSCIGAPKIRAMGIIEHLEGSRRGPYTGALGWLGLDGSMGLSVAIRTLVFRDDRVSYGVGGGIVYESQPRAEWEEALLKGRALREALRSTHAEVSSMRPRRPQEARQRPRMVRSIS